MDFSRIRKSLAAVGIALALGGGAAQAADLIIPVAPVPDPVFDWTGFYAGVHLGYASAGVTGEWEGNQFLGDLVPYDMTGGFVGGQVGYNHQMDMLVLGVEGSVSIGAISGGELQFENANNPDLTVTAESTMNWFGDIVARGGVAVNENLLVYGTVGIAAAYVDLEVTAEGDLDAVANDAHLHIGPTIGIGAEYRLDDQWSIGADLRYAALGAQDYSDPSVIDGTASISVDRTTLSLRLNYSF